MPEPNTSYPVRVDADLDRTMSRWLWLVKWLLAIPHFFVLVFLWTAFAVLSIIAFVAIMFTSHYPRSLFEFNVGVLRWSWRVAFYAYGTLGTDRYPPFTLADVPDYPAHFDVAYPAQLSRRLALVKWWLLAIPHYLVIGVFVGTVWAFPPTLDRVGSAPGLIGLLVLIAAIVLAFTGRYPRQIFDFVLGMNRWALRVAAYAGLLTDKYPPFRLDLGGHEQAGAETACSSATAASEYDTAHTSVPSDRRGWTAGRAVVLAAGCVVGLAALAALGAGGVATWATTTQRDTTGYLTSATHRFETSSSAITSDSISMHVPADWLTPADLLGTVRMRVTSVNPNDSVFVGIAPEAKVEQYLDGVAHLEVNDWAAATARGEVTTGDGAPVGEPSAAGIWASYVSGPGAQSLEWGPTNGSWAVVVMNAHGQPGIAVSADVGVTVPALSRIAGGLIAIGTVLMAAAVMLIAIPVARASRKVLPDAPRYQGGIS